MKPEITEQLNGYDFTWDEHGISISVSRIRETNTTLNGELIVRHRNGDGKLSTILPTTKINIVSGNARRDLAKSLTAKTDAIPWEEIIDQLAFGVESKFRGGEPAETIWIDDSDIIKPDYLIHPYILKGVPTILFGEKGVSKSTVMLYLYICLLLPWEDNPIGLIVPDKSIKSLILDWEQEKQIVEYYARRIRLGNNLPPFDLNYLHCSRPLADDLQKIQEMIVKFDAEVVFIDSLGAACGGDLNKPEKSIEFFAGLRQLQTKDKKVITPIILGQTSKDNETKKKSIFGSTFFTYYARSIMEICKSELSGDNEIDVALFHRWFNYGKLEKPLGFLITYQDDNGIRFASRSVDMNDFLDKVSNNQKILDALSRGALSTVDIMSNTGIPQAIAYNTVKRLKDKGKIVKLPDGRWGLAVKESH